MSTSERKDGTSVPTQEDQLPAVVHNELSGDNLLAEYLNATGMLFGDFHKSPEDIDRIARDSETGGFVTARLYKEGSTVPTAAIERRVRRDVDGIIIITDYAGSRDSSLPSVEERKIAEPSFEINPEGKIIKQPDLSSNSPVERVMRDRLNSVVREFKRAVKVEGSTIYVGNVKKFVSDGTMWVPFNPPGGLAASSSHTAAPRTINPAEGKGLPPPK